jgi:hypothetical protein
MAEPSVDRDIGRLEERSLAAERRLGAVEEKLDQVLETLQHARGGWRMLMIVGGGCAAIGSFVTAVWSTISGKH